MTIQPDKIYLTWPQATGFVLLFLILPVLIICLLMVIKRTGRNSSHEPDWSVPVIGDYSGKTTFFHSWDPRMKLGILFLFCLLIVSLQNLESAILALSISGVSVLICGPPLRRLCKRLAAISGFLVMLLIILPITVPNQPGETLLILPFAPLLPLHSSGFILGLTIVCKATAIALLMEPMIGTSSIATTLEALQRLGIPPALTQMIHLTYRYTFVFIAECRRMYRAMKARGFAPGTDLTTMKIMGNFFGMLFIQSYTRTRYVYEAMLSRGYTGTLPRHSSFHLSINDLIKAGLWLLIALFLLLYDRLPLG